jgi:thiosulfate reductase cytochrome b subunit
MHPLLNLGFPLWLRISHFLNVILTLLLIRSGLQIFADHPELYWNDDCTPGTEWLKLGKKKMPKDSLWTSRDEAEPINSVLGITGGEHKLGTARRWHFLPIILWITNGLIYVTLLFVSGQWRRLIPTSWSIIPAAIHTQITYLTFHIPPLSVFNPYDPLQQLAYASIVFIVSPLMILTGIAMSPGFTARFPRYLKFFGGKQAARSIHFIGMIILCVFTIVHVTLDVVVHGRQNLLNITLGNPAGNIHLALLIFGTALFFIAFVMVGVTWYTRSNE